MKVVAESPPPLLPPHEYLPPEIMSLIFAHIMEEQSSRYVRPTRRFKAPKDALKPQRYLLNLKLVCSVWKEIIEATPEPHLNYIMTVTPSKKLGEQFPEIIARASEWFFSSGALRWGLRIHVLGAYKFGGTTALMRPFFQTIAPRLRLLYYKGPYRQLTQFLDAYDPSQSPDLEELHLQAQDTPFKDEGDDVITYSFVSNKHLTSLTIAAEATCFINPGYRYRLDIPWNQLQKLVIANYNKGADWVRFLFLQCHNLVECNLLDIGGWEQIIRSGQHMRGKFGPDNNPGRAENDTFVHSRLRRLEISCAQGTGISPLFWTLRLPALQSLTLHDGYYYSNDAHSILTRLYELYQRAPFPLTHLQLSRCRAPVGPLLELLITLGETLVHLEIDDCDCFNKTFITNMTLPADPSRVGPNSTGKSIAPKLERFVLQQRNYVYVREQMLVDFVQSRVYDGDSLTARHFGPAALKFVRLGTGVQQYIEPELVKSWQEKGCDYGFSWTYFPNSDS